jgi:hypothetical protein
MLASARLDGLWDELRLTPDQQLAALQTGYVIREPHRNGYRYRLRFRAGCRLLSRYLGRHDAAAKQMEQLLAAGRQRQMLADIGNARRALRDAERLRRQLHSLNAVRGRLAHERDHAPDAGHHLNDMETLTMDDAKVASGEAPLGEDALEMQNSSDQHEAEGPDADQWDEDTDDDDEDDEDEDDDDYEGGRRQAPLREIQEAEWEHTVDSAQGDSLFTEIVAPPQVAEPDLASAQQERPSAEAELLDAEVPRHPALVRLDQADEQALPQMDPEEWLDLALRHKCKEITYKLACGAAMKLSASSDPLAAMNTIERPLQMIAKLMKEVNKTQPRERNKQGKGGDEDVEETAD